MAGPRRTQPRRDEAMPQVASIGRELAQRRVQLGLTQQTLADLSGVSRSSIQAIERGSGAIKLSSMVEIAGTLGLRVVLTAGNG
jgi:transcriptional regulator with XRE-family HTH domain